MNRRAALKSLSLGLTALGLEAALPRMKITRVRYYRVAGEGARPIFNQSSHIVTIETDEGLIGIGEGGHKDSIEQLAAIIVGEDPSRIEHLWQLMYRQYFYPPGREEIHALGALDLALFDIKGKALGVPAYELLGGLTRDYVECYSTGCPSAGSLRADRASLHRVRLPRLPLSRGRCSRRQHGVPPPEDGRRDVSNVPASARGSGRGRRLGY